jgi:putative tryptophan/tyrosine transport system substrate-binding protein
VDRRAFIAGTLTLLAGPLAAGAQQTRKVYRIGVLEMVTAASNAANLSPFRRGFGELGYVEGQNFVIEYRSADGHAERFPDLAIELVGLNVDVIVTRGTPAALSAKQATATTPIVMASSGDPAAEGVVASLARPGGNVTGLHIMAPPELGGTRLQLLREAMPGTSRVGILWNSGNIYSALIVRETERIARAMGIELKSLEVQRPEAFGQAFNRRDCREDSRG